MTAVTQPTAPTVTPTNICTYHRPWGTYTTLFMTEGHSEDTLETAGEGPIQIQVKAIVCFPGEELSLQSHRFREEDWFVEEGEATITVGEHTATYVVGQTVHIPLGAKHQLANRAESGIVRIIEVQRGTYLGEDDITRYGDKYGRP